MSDIHQSTTRSKALSEVERERRTAKRHRGVQEDWDVSHKSQVDVGNDQGSEGKREGNDWPGCSFWTLALLRVWRQSCEMNPCHVGMLHSS
jgi:hypothetical protein